MKQRKTHDEHSHNEDLRRIHKDQSNGLLPFILGYMATIVAVADSFFFLSLGKFQGKEAQTSSIRNSNNNNDD